MLANMRSPSVNLALCLTVFTPCVLSGALVGSPQRSLRVETQFLASEKTAERFDPFAEEHFYGHLKCGATVQVGSADHKFEMCPEECPYYAQDLDDDLHCSFVCVTATDCATRNPKRPIADVIKGHKTCRGPVVSDCEEYNYDGTDSCQKCQLFYSVAGDGLCHFDHWFIVVVVVCVILVFVLFLVLWVVDCCIRPVKNREGLEKGEHFRSLQKIRDHAGELYGEGETQGEQLDSQGNPVMIKAGGLWSVKLWERDVAGPGMLLHFRLQIFIIVWAFVVALIWLIMAIVIDNALFILGTRRFGTPRENCILVAWGYETQQRLMWTKVTFLVITYIFTFLFALAHAIRQQQEFARIDNEEKTMKDYMGFLTGLNHFNGGEHPDLEKKLMDHLENKCKLEDLVGVSIAWNYGAHQETIEGFLEKDMLRRDQTYQGDKWQEPGPLKGYPEEFGGVRKMFYKWENSLMGSEEEEQKSEEQFFEEQRELIKTIETSEDAFIVFKTEDARDKAVLDFESLSDADKTFLGGVLNLEPKVCEPDTINWQNYGNSTPTQRLLRLIQGFGCILLALFFWTTVFYAPYAYQVFCFNYDNGAQPPFTLALTFCMVVVLGNAIMYEVCARVSDYIGFKTRDDRESCYLILYVVACMFNVLLDMVTTYFLSEYILDGLGFRTYYGVRFREVPTFTERFETYAMQRMLAENTKTYSFPATFLIPFLIEPFVTVIVPYLMGKTIVGSHREWRGRDAEKFMAAFEFDMGRYGDLLLDMVLGILIFFFPGGYTLIIFFGMAGSHAYIYSFDHARVLRTIPKCVYASMDVDWWGCWMMAPITAMIPMCLVFKANCQDYGYCIKGPPLMEAMWIAYILHTIIHTVLLKFVVPLFVKESGKDPNEGLQYETSAANFPCNWFTANPIHCLRSQLLGENSPTGGDYCTFSMLGKAHLLNSNAKAGCYFTKPEGKSEEFVDFAQSVKGAFRRSDKKAAEGQ